MTRFCALLIAFALPLALCAQDKKDEKKEDKKGVDFTSKEGKFSVTLPSKPKEQSNKIPTDAGEVDAHMFLVDLKDRAYLVSYNDYKAGSVGANTEKVLGGVVDGSARGVKGKLVKDEKITLGEKKYPGHDITIELPGNQGFYRAKVYLVGDRLYQVVALGPDEFIKSKPVEEYFKSFKLAE